MTKQEFIQQFCIANGSMICEALKVSNQEQCHALACWYVMLGKFVADEIYSENEEPERDKNLDIDIYNTDLTVRALTACKALNVKTLEDLTKLSRKDFLQLRNVGNKSITEIKEFVERYGYHLKRDIVL